MKKIPDILLVELPPWDPRTVPLGIAYLATFLKSKDVNVKVFDLNIEMYNSESDERKKGWGNEDFHWWQSDRLEKRYLLIFEHFADRILSFDTRVIGFSSTLPSIPFLNHLLKYLKKKSPDRIIIVGGPATFFPEIRRKDFDRSLINYFVVGDGEIALYELLNSLKDNGRLSLRSKLSLRKHASCRIWKDNLFDKTVCIQMPKIMDLDSIPSPTFEEFNLPAYTEGDFTLPIIFSKGCTRHCTFCSDVVLSRPYRCRKAENVIKEINTHLKRYNNIYTFRLNDLSFNINLKFLNEFCDRIIAEDLRIQWYGQAQVRPDMDDKLLSKMKKAGCKQFSLGLESFSDHVLAMMRKGYTAEEAIMFLKRSKEAEIENHIAIIVGFPGETEEDFNITLEGIRQNVAYIDRICSLNICGMPIGSELQCFPKKYSYFSLPDGDGNWVTSDYTNTSAVRKERYKEVIRYCNELDIPVDGCWDLKIFEEIFGKKQQRLFVNATYLYEKLLVKHPEDSALIKKLADIYNNQELFDKATPLYEKLLAKDPENPTLIKNLADLYNNQKLFDKAYCLYEKLLIKHPEDSALMKNLANIYYNQKLFDKASYLYEKLLVKHPEDNALVKKIKNLADFYNSQKLFDKATPLYEKLLAKDPDNPTLIKNLADLYHLQELFDKATPLYEKLLAKDPDNPTLMKDLAEIYNSQKLFDKATPLYEKLLAKDPDNPGPIKSLADIYNNQKLFDKATSLYEKLLAKDPDNLTLMKNLADIYHLQELFDKASTLYEKLLIKHPEDSALMKKLAEIYNNQNLLDKATPLYEKLLAKDPDNLTLMKDLAEIYNSQKLFDKAIPLYRELLNYESDNAELIKCLTDIYNHQPLYKVMNRTEKDTVKLPTYCCIALLESCFLRCRMCYKWKDDINFRDPQEPTLEEWKCFISSLKKLVKGKFQINFAGGEPLSRKETPALIKYAHDQGFDTLLATNAVLIDEEMARRIADSGLTVANISLDSLEEERHDYLRGVKGVYRKVMSAIELLNKYASNIKIGICTVIVDGNLNELGEIVRWIQANDKIDGMGFQAVTQPFSTPEDLFWYKNEEYSHLWPKDISKVDKAMNELIEMKQNGFDKLGNPLSQFCVYKAYFRNPNKFIKKQKCHIDMQAINITPTGEIRICFYMEPIGNIKSDDINDVWFSQEAKNLRKKITNCKKNCQSMVNCNFDESEVYIF